jgi:5-methylcytosine-specific restriction enzyme A
MNLRGQERREFPLSVRKLAFKRCCGTDGKPRCENCGNILRAGNIEYEHIVPAGLGGDPTLENCGVWCAIPCSSKKTHTEDNPRMVKADRVLRKTYGLKPSRQKIQSAGFRKAAPQRTATRPLVRRISQTQQLETEVE